MFLKLNHQSLDVYKVVSELTKELYFISAKLPVEEKFNMVQQIRRADLSVKLNLAEGSSRLTAIERKRFLEISISSLVEVDAMLENAVDLSYFTTEEIGSIGLLLNKSFAMLSKMI